MAMTAVEDQSQGTVRKSRKGHYKSRTGCFECKRRRVKCDEAKPSCTRCYLGLDKCMYPSVPQPATREQKGKFHILCSSINVVSPPPNTSSHSERSLSFEAPPRLTSAYIVSDCCSNVSNAPKGLSDIDLYRHYLQHTSHTLSPCRSDHSVLHIGIPKLALQSETVFHSLLAVSAASLAWDMISKEPLPDTNRVSQVLLTGYQHYNRASEKMRELISGLGALKLEPLIASALVLVPFATASQQINHWISSRSGAHEPHRPLSSTPRDVIIILRGIRTMLQTLDCGGLSTNFDPSPEMERGIDGSSTSPAANPRSSAPVSSRTSRTHVMSAVIATTSQGAFFKLQHRLNSVLLCQNNFPDQSLSACTAAFEILEQIRSSAFYTTSPSLPPSPSLSSPATESLQPESTSSPRVAPWLRAFAYQSITTKSIIPQPTQPLTRFFLSFLSQAPQAYLDLVLPLLDQRLESPTGASSGRIRADLTKKQALALDIYAHWSVLMFLVEDESWWIGTLPEVTLTGMVNRYGEGFVSRLWPNDGPGEGQWWPGSMLNILREIKRYR
ncbi:hypothetical protein GQ44DRAFT_731654 [Phaeosphaeriaceae sp. PMI808]|nr:hypothetical protein GQ44DRAFT_731654 [Phaeosphaeriaceae sp. PMI808]